MMEQKRISYESSISGKKKNWGLNSILLSISSAFLAFLTQKNAVDDKKLITVHSLFSRMQFYDSNLNYGL